MSKINTDVVYLRSENARMRLIELAHKLKKSPQRLKYTVRQLEREGVIQNPHTIIDYSYFGLILFRVYFKGGYISEKEKYLIIKKLSDNPYVVAIYELGGEFDFAVELLSPNPSRFNKELKKVADLIPTLNTYKIILNIVTHIYPRTYLIRDDVMLPTVEQEIIVGGDRERQSFTRNELIVLQQLLAQPQARITTLSRATALNARTLLSLLSRLEERKVIRGFKATVDTSLLGVLRTRLFLRLHNLSHERDIQLRGYLRKTREIVAANKTVGDWSMEIDIESFDQARIRYIIVEIRDSFKDLIESFNFMEYFRYHKKTYLPAYLFSPENIPLTDGDSVRVA